MACRQIRKHKWCEIIQKEGRNIQLSNAGVAARRKKAFHHQEPAGECQGAKIMDVV
jgi:hypothetical protein